MINRSADRGLIRFACAGLAAGLVVLAGCSEEPAPQVQARPQPKPAPAAPPKPKVTPVATLMANLRIDERIDLAEEHAPPTDPERKAVLEFFDAFARGDDSGLGEMLTLADNLELQTLVSSGQWSQHVDRIDSIEVQTGTSDYGPCALAVFAVGSTFEPQLWYYHADGGDYTFEAAAQPPQIVERLSGTDWIKAWHEILKEEVAKAEQPDEDVELPQRNLDENSDDDDSSSAGSGSGSPGGLGGGRGNRRPPKKDKRRPPGPG